MWAVKVTGLPVTKGDLQCFGRGGRHTLTEKKKVGRDEWRARVLTAGQLMHKQIGYRLEDCPVSVEITFTLPCPPSVRPESRLWPHVFGSGDIEKFVRLVHDQFTHAQVWKDDAQVVELTTRKTYPHTPAPDLVTAGGALIRIWLTET